MGWGSGQVLTMNCIPNYKAMSEATVKVWLLKPSDCDSMQLPYSQMWPAMSEQVLLAMLYPLSYGMRNAVILLSSLVISFMCVHAFRLLTSLVW